MNKAGGGLRLFKETVDGNYILYNATMGILLKSYSCYKGHTNRLLE